MILNALESPRDAADALRVWKKSFSFGAARLSWGGKPVFWHERLGVWGYFGETERSDGSRREWNVFGEVPRSFKRNMIVEINPPRHGVNLNLQGVFAADNRGRRWLLHQGRMSVPGRRIKQSDFAALTSLQPVEVHFTSGTVRHFYQVGCIDYSAQRLQRDVAHFVQTCSLARAQFVAPPKLGDAIKNLPGLVHSLKPEKGGTYKTAPKGPATARRRHADVWDALVQELECRGIGCFNTRIRGYGPDLFTLVKPFVLFEIKTTADPGAIFAGIGQLQIYESLLNQTFRKVLVVPEDISQILADELDKLNIKLVGYHWKRVGPVLDAHAVEGCLS